MHKLYELKEELVEELEKYSGKEITASNLDDIDKLAHAAKNICKLIESDRGYSGEGSYRMSYESSYADDLRGERGTYSARRGRGMGARRDSIGRYASDNGMMIQQLREMMEDAPDEQTRKELQRLMQRMEQ